MVLDGHISDKTFDRYARREAAASEILRTQAHLAVCAECRVKLAQVTDAEKAFAAVRNNFAFEDFADEPEHLAYEQLEFLVDNQLDEVTREIAESHLAVCGECARDLTDLRMYREISVAAPAPLTVAEQNNTAVAPPRAFWRKIFAFDSIGNLAPVAAVLLIALMLSAWFFLLRGKRANEIARTEANPNAAPSNSNPVNNSPVSNLPPNASPEVSPSPTNESPNGETLYALNDGQLTIDGKGNLKGAENLSPAAQNLIRQSLQSGKVTLTDNSLGGSSGVLMGDGNADRGVPFALRSPVGKVLKETQPVLQWKPLDDAQRYTVAIVDENFRVVAESEKLTTTSWQPSKPLPRGANYSWQVTATRNDGTETVSPAAPAPQARFRVIEQNLFDDINRLEKSGTPSHLALGVLYAKAGLRQAARAEFEKLVEANPASPFAKKLLQSVK